MWRALASKPTKEKTNEVVRQGWSEVLTGGDLPTSRWLVPCAPSNEVTHDCLNRLPTLRVTSSLQREASGSSGMQVLICLLSPYSTPASPARTRDGTPVASSWALLQRKPTDTEVSENAIIIAALGISKGGCQQYDRCDIKHHARFPRPKRRRGEDIQNAYSSYFSAFRGRPALIKYRDVRANQVADIDVVLP